MNKVKLSTLGTFKNGANYPKGSYGVGTPIINVKDLFKGRFIQEEGLDELKPHALKNENIYYVKNGDILFTRSSLVRSGAGMCAMVNKLSQDVLFCGFIIRFRPDITKVNPLYLLYLLRSPHYRKLFTGTQQTNITNICQDTLGDIDIILPASLSTTSGIEIQEKTIKVLDKIDSKIELNLQICDELESMAKTLYDYWFVQFDFPDENGNPYRTSGGAMVWNDQLKREIPKGWSIGKIKQLGSIIAGGTPNTKCEEYYCGCGFAWITPNDLSGNEDKMFISHGDRDITQAGIDNSSATLMPKGSVLLSTRAPIGYLAIAENELTTNQGFKAIIPDFGYSEYYIYYLLQRSIPALEKQGVGTTFKEISKDTLAEFKVLLPSKSIANRFAESIKSTCELRAKLEKENRELTKLRDWLLPMLMNGQATVE